MNDEDKNEIMNKLTNFEDGFNRFKISIENKLKEPEKKTENKYKEWADNYFKINGSMYEERVRFLGKYDDNSNVKVFKIDLPNANNDWSIAMFQFIIDLKKRFPRLIIVHDSRDTIFIESSKVYYEHNDDFNYNEEDEDED
jgi:coproporphyrinogen III oxidase